MAHPSRLGDGHARLVQAPPAQGDRGVELELPAFQARWLDAQEHSGTNIGETDTRAVFVELKEPAPGHGSESIDTVTLGPR